MIKLSSHSVILLAIQWLCTLTQLSARELSIPEYQVNPGALVQIPIHLDDTSSLSSIEFSINFDPSILILKNVKNGAIGKLFEETSSEIDEGTIHFSFTSAEEIGTHSGNLSIMTFQLREGAEIDSYSEIAISSFRFGDSSGVVALHQMQAHATTKGKAIVSESKSIDNYKNGLPDWWETNHNLDHFQNTSALQDPDGDGLINFLEFAFVGNPTQKDRQSVSPKHSFVNLSEGQKYNALKFRRRVDEDAPSYIVWESTNLKDWYPMNTPLNAVNIIDHEDGTETVEVLGSINSADASSPKQAFLKIEVE